MVEKNDRYRKGWMTYLRNVKEKNLEKYIFLLREKHPTLESNQIKVKKNKRGNCVISYTFKKQPKTYIISIDAVKRSALIAWIAAYFIFTPIVWLWGTGPYVHDMLWMVIFATMVGLAMYLIMPWWMTKNSRGVNES